MAMGSIGSFFFSFHHLALRSYYVIADWRRWLKGKEGGTPNYFQIGILQIAAAAQAVSVYDTGRKSRRRTFF